jgi:hypothetical protein
MVPSRPFGGTLVDMLVRMPVGEATSGVVTVGDGARRLRDARWAWLAGFAIAALVLYPCYLFLSRKAGVTSDGASNALEGWDLLHGNVLLRGWTVTDLSFYTVEVPLHAVLEAMFGLGANVQHEAAAVVYTVLVLLAGWLAKGRATGREAVLRVLVTCGLMLAPQVGPGVFIVLLAPDHTGSAIPVLLAWLAIDRGPRTWITPALAGLALAWVQAGDAISVVTGVGPLLLVCAVRVLRARLRDRQPLRSQRFELSLAVAGLAATAAGVGADLVIRAAGGFRLQSMHSTSLGSLGSLPGHVVRTAEGVLQLFGADYVGLPFGGRAAFAFLHLAGVALAVAAVCAGVRRFWRGDDIVTSLLTASVLVNLFVYAVSTLPVTNYSTRQIAGILPAAAVLAGRWLSGTRLAGPLLRWTLPVLGVILTGYVAALGYSLAQPSVPAATQDLADWLAGHQLSYGLSGYGFANVTTLASGGRAVVRQATFANGAMGIGNEYYNRSWYDPARNDATFFVLNTQDDGTDPVTYAEAVQAFGKPAHVFRYRRYVILTWDKNLLRNLR